MKLAAYQVCTHWRKTGVDGEGKDVFAQPVEFLARWEERAAKFQEHNGDERISNSVIYLGNYELLKPGDFVAEGSRNTVILTLMTDEEIAQLALEKGLSLEAFTLLLQEDTANVGWDYLLMINRKSPGIRSVRARNRVKSVNSKEQLVKVYCQ